MNEAKHDVEPHLYTTVIREMIRHENDVTNHRIMWLLIVQGLIANAAVTAGKESGESASALATVGVLVTIAGPETIRPTPGHALTGTPGHSRLAL